MVDQTAGGVSGNWPARAVVLVPGALVALHALDHPLVRGPELLAPSTWGAWVGAVGAPGVLMAILRLAAVAMCWYLLTATVLLLVARATRDRTTHALVAAVLGPHGRHVLVAVVGTGVLATVPVRDERGDVEQEATGDMATTAVRWDTTGGAVPADPGRPRAPGLSGASAVPQLVRLAGPRLVALPPPAQDPPLLHRLDDDAAAPAAEPGDHREPDGPDSDREWWTVEAGDHFWHIAEEHLRRHRGSTPPEEDVRRYWRRLVAANRDLLVDGDNPDLLLPGQLLRVPQLPTSPTTRGQR